MKNQLISIIIPTYNGEKYIQRAILSVLNQTFEDFEVIVVDRLARTVLAKVVLTNVKYLSDKWCREIKEDPYYNEKYI